MSGDLLVLVESNTTGTGRLFPEAARTLGLHPVLLAADPARYAWSGAVEAVRTDTDSTEAVVDACRALAATRRLAGITTSSDYFVGTAAAAAAALGLPGHAPDAVAAVRDKGAQRRVLAEAGVRVPRFTVTGSVHETLEAAGSLGYPVVVKPVTGSGSLGVRLCTDPDETARHAATVLAREHNERGVPVPRRLTVEEFVTGDEYSAEVQSGAVVGVTRKHLGELPLFVETGHDFPAPLAPEAREAVTAAAEAAVRALGLTLGPAHVELRLGPDGPVLIEVNPRLAGGWIPRLVQEATGVDLILETVKAYAGRPSAPGATPRGGAAIRFVTAPGDGVLSHVDGVAEARTAPGVIDVEIYREPGDRVALAGDFRDRIGHVLARGDSPAAAAAAAAEGLHRIRPALLTGEEVPA
ncbi:ATP-grasp domain-containing protein [Streptomyces sp. NPDC096198]|uniref:ATP-grasp domain-containing protein n=1 Tax=Streptomyces sp. NPDC096198 TaxID=3366080 RepID=UPI0038104A34